MEVWVSPGAGNEDDWRQEIAILEERRRYACDRAYHLYQQAPSTRRRPKCGGAPGRTHALRAAVADLL